MDKFPKLSYKIAAYNYANPTPESSYADLEDPVQSTNNSATTSKRSAVDSGYWSDKFIHAFDPIPRKCSPLLHRGYFYSKLRQSFLKAKKTKTNAELKSLLKKRFPIVSSPATMVINPKKTPLFQTSGSPPPSGFIYSPPLSPRRKKTPVVSNSSKKSQLVDNPPKTPLKDHNNPCQIISMGAGYDTTYFRLKSMNNAPFLYVELDFPTVIHKKRKILRQHPSFSQWNNFNLCSWMKDASAGEGIHKITNDYVLGECDLSAGAANFEKILIQCGINFSIPTFFLSECVLIYIRGNETFPLLQFIQKKFDCSFLVNYEQINPYDAFGKTMVERLENVGSPLKSITDYPTLASQRLRYLNAGFGSKADRLLITTTTTDPLKLPKSLNKHEESSRVKAWTLLECSHIAVPSHLNGLMNQLEPFDEWEEWELIMSHYCLTAVSNDIESTKNSDTVTLKYFEKLSRYLSI